MAEADIEHYTKLTRFVCFTVLHRNSSAPEERNVTREINLAL